MKLRPLPHLVWKAAEALALKNGIEISGYIAFTAMLALFPFLIFLVSVGGFLGDTSTGQEFMNTMALLVPPDVLNTLQPAMQEVLKSRSTSLLTFGLLFSLYSAASGVDALRTALNLSYGVEETRSFWLRKAANFLAVIIGSFILLLSSVAVILGPFVWRLLAWFTTLDPTDQSAWHLIRYAFTFLLMTGGVVALHRYLPNTKLTLGAILPGAFATTVLWIAAASLLTIYFAEIANYTATYGGLGGVIVTLMFFYVSGIIFIFGGELNALLLIRRHKHAQPGSTEHSTSPHEAAHADARARISNLARVERGDR